MADFIKKYILIWGGCATRIFKNLFKKGVK